MIKKINPTGRRYRRLAIKLALTYCPPIRPCRKCTHPVVYGYCCSTCGTSRPDTTKEEDDAFDTKYGSPELGIARAYGRVK